MFHGEVHCLMWVFSLRFQATEEEREELGDVDEEHVYCFIVEYIV